MALIPNEGKTSAKELIEQEQFDNNAHSSYTPTQSNFINRGIYLYMSRGLGILSTPQIS